MKQVATILRRFFRWQQAVPHYACRHEGEVQHCHNCGRDFDGNFCPVCGQRAGVGRVGWQSVRENVAMRWGMGSRSPGYTLLQLLGRPGCLVRDYISGRRQVSFPPVKMPVIVCLFVVVFESVFHLKSEVLKLSFKVKEIDDVVAWTNARKSWATLLLQSLYILPAWLVFRHAPACPRHTLPEGFFLQVFLSVPSLLLVFIGYWSRNVELVVWTACLYIACRQLFGYGWWCTLWRLAVVMTAQLSVVLFAVTAVIFAYEMRENGDDDTVFAFMFILAVTVATPAVMLLVAHRINRRSCRRQTLQD